MFGQGKELRTKELQMELGKPTQKLTIDLLMAIMSPSPKELALFILAFLALSSPWSPIG
jgi:hypothetical protein